MNAFSLSDIIASLPQYKTTETLDERAVMHIATADHAVLKRRFQKLFEAEWQAKKAQLKKDYGIISYEAVATNALVETRNISDFGISGKGGLKIIFNGKDNQPLAFIWMRGSGTEPVFRVMCDIKGDNSEMEAKLLQWERSLIESADKI